MRLNYYVYSSLASLAEVCFVSYAINVYSCSAMTSWVGTETDVVISLFYIGNGIDFSHKFVSLIIMQILERGRINCCLALLDPHDPCSAKLSDRFFWDY